MLDVILILFLLLLFLGALNIYQYEMNNSMQGVEEDLDTLNKAHSALEHIRSNQNATSKGVKVTSQTYSGALKSVENRSGEAFFRCAIYYQNLTKK